MRGMFEHPLRDTVAFVAEDDRCRRREVDGGQRLRIFNDRRQHGIEIAVFRGSERNKRRGFHNLSVLAEKMKLLEAAKPKRRGRIKHG